MTWDGLNENVRHCGPRGVINIIRKIDRSKRIISLENFIFIHISSLRLSKEILIFSCLITISWLCTFIFCTPKFQISMWWPKLQNNIKKCKMVDWSILKIKISTRWTWAKQFSRYVTVRGSEVIFKIDGFQCYMGVFLFGFIKIPTYI